MRMADCDTDNYDNQTVDRLSPTTKGETREDEGKREANKEEKGPLHMTQTTIDKGWSPLSGISENSVDRELVLDNIDDPVGSSASPQIAECDSVQSSSHVTQDTDAATLKLTTVNSGGKAATSSNHGNIESSTSPETSICAVSSTVDDDEEKECRTVSSSFTASTSVSGRRESFDNIFKNASVSGSSLLASELLKQPTENSLLDINRKRSSSHIVKTLLGFPETGSSSENEREPAEKEDGESQAKKLKPSGFEAMNPESEGAFEERNVDDKSQDGDCADIVGTVSNEHTNNELVTKGQDKKINKDDSLQSTDNLANPSLPEVADCSKTDHTGLVPKADKLFNSPEEEVHENVDLCKVSVVNWSKSVRQPCANSDLVQAQPVTSTVSPNTTGTIHRRESPIRLNNLSNLNNSDCDNENVESVSSNQIVPSFPFPAISKGHRDKLVNHKKDGDGSSREESKDSHVEINQDHLSSSVKDSTQDLPSTSVKDCTGDLLSSSVKDSAQDHLSPSDKDSTQDIHSSSVKDSTRDLLPSSDKDSARDLLPSSDKDSTQDLLPSSVKDSTQELLPSFDKDSTQDLLPSSLKDSAQDLLPLSDKDSRRDFLSSSVKDPTPDHLSSSVKDPAQINVSSEAGRQDIAESHLNLSPSTSLSSSSNLISSSSFSSSSSQPITTTSTPPQSLSTQPVDSSCVTSSSKTNTSEMVLTYADGQFKCQLCTFSGEQVKFEDHLFKHMEDQTLRCDDCSADIYSISAWHQHLLERHEGERVLPTNVCEIIDQVKTTGIQKYSLRPFVRLVGEDKPPSLVAKILSSDLDGQLSSPDQKEQAKQSDSAKPELCSQTLSSYLEFTFVNKEYFCLKCAKKFKDKEIFRYHIWTHTHSPESTYCCCTTLTRESCEVVANIIQLISNMNQSPITSLTSDDSSSKEKIVICRVRRTDLKLETVFRKPSEIKNLYLSTLFLGNRDVTAERSSPVELSDPQAVTEFPKSLGISAKDSETPKLAAVLKETVIVENPLRAGTDHSTIGSLVTKGCEKLSHVNSLVNSRSTDAKGLELRVPAKTPESNISLNSFEPEKKKFKLDSDLSRIKIKREPGEDLLLADINQKILNIKKEVKEFASLTDMLCDMSSPTSKVLSPAKPELSPSNQDEVLDLKVCSSLNADEELKKAPSSNSSSHFSFGNIGTEQSKTPKTTLEGFGSSVRSLMNSEASSRSVDQEKRGAFYKCGFNGCQFACMNSIEFRSHLENAHKYMTDYPCAHCGHMATGEDSLLRHMQSHTMSKVFLLYKCSFIGCRFGTNLLHEFREHNEILHQHETSFKCLNCSVVFYELSELISHLKNNLLKFIQCPHCSVKDRNRQAVLSHISEAHPGKPKQIVVTSQVVCREKQGEVINTPSLSSEHPTRLFDQAKSLFPPNNDIEIIETRLKTNDIPPALQLTLEHHEMANSSSHNSKSKFFPLSKEQRLQFKEITELYLHSCKLCKYSTNQAHLLEEHIQNYHPSFLGDVIKPQIPDFSVLPTSQKDMLYNFKLDPPKSLAGFENKTLAKAGCHLCPVAYKHVQQLKTHVRVKHPNCTRLDFYKCIHCNAKSTSKEYLVNSCKKRHPNKEIHLTRVQEVLEHPKKKNSGGVDIIVKHNQESSATQCCEHGSLPPCFQCDLRAAEKDLGVIKNWKNHLFGNQGNEDSISEKDKPFVCTVFKNMVKPTKVQRHSPILTVPSAKSALPKIAFKPKSKSRSSGEKKKKAANAASNIDNSSDFLPPCEIGSQTLDAKVSVLYTRNRKWNRCKCCQFTTDHVATIHHHILDCHLKLYLWTCPYCDLKSIKKQNIIQHCLHFHEAKKPGAKFENQDWNKHIRSILNLLPKNTSASTFTKQTFIISGPSSETPNCYRLATEPLSIPASLTKPNRPTVVKLSNGVYKCSVCKVKGFIEWQVQRHIETEHWMELRETEGQGGMSNLVLDLENPQADMTDGIAGASDNAPNPGNQTPSSDSISKSGPASQTENHHDDIELSSLNNPSSKDEEMKAMAQKIIEVSPGVLQCPFCSYRSRLRTCVKCHIWSQHMMLKRKRCKHCSFASWFDSGIEAHMATEHPRFCFGDNQTANSGYTVLVEEPDGTWKETMVNFVHATKEMLSRKRPSPKSANAEENRKKSKKSPHPNQYTKKTPHPNQYTKKAPHPNQYTKKTPHPNQYTKKTPHPNQYTKKTPHPNQYTKKTPHPNQYTKKTPHPNQYTKKTPHPNQYTKKTPHPNQYTKKLSESLDNSSGVLNLSSKKSNESRSPQLPGVSRPGVITSSKSLNTANSSKSNKPTKPGLVISPKFFKMSKSGVINLSKTPLATSSSSSAKSDPNTTTPTQNKLNVINVPKFKARDSSANLHEENSEDEASNDGSKGDATQEQTKSKNIFSRLLGRTEESSEAAKRPSNSSPVKLVEKALPDSLISIDTRMEEMCIREFDEKLMRHTFTCTICSYKTNNRTTFNSHCYSHKPPAFKCGYCPFRANPRCRVTAHIRKYHKEPMIKIINLSNLPKVASDKNPPMTKELFGNVLPQQKKKVGTNKSSKENTVKSHLSSDSTGNKVHGNSNSGDDGNSSDTKQLRNEDDDFDLAASFNDSMDGFGDEEDLYSSLTFCCHSCSFRTKNIDRFTKHTSLHNFFTHGMKVACMDCSFSTNRILDYEDHISRHMDGFLFYCGCCSFSSLEEQEVREHSLKKHPDRVISIEISPGPSSLSTKWSPVDLDPSVELTDFLAMDCERFYNLISMYGVTMVDLKSTAVSYEDMNDKSGSDDSGTELDIAESPGEEEDDEGVVDEDEAATAKDVAEEPDEDFGVIKPPLKDSVSSVSKRKKKRKGEELTATVGKRSSVDNSSPDVSVQDNLLNPLDMSDKDISNDGDLVNNMNEDKDEVDEGKINDKEELEEPDKGDEKEEESSKTKLKLKSFPHIKFSEDSDIENYGDIDDDDDIEQDEIYNAHDSDDDDIGDGPNTSQEDNRLKIVDIVKEGFETENEKENNVRADIFDLKESETNIKVNETLEDTPNYTDDIKDINKSTDHVGDKSDESDNGSQINNKSKLTEPQSKEMENDYDLLTSDKEDNNNDDNDNSKSSRLNNEPELTEPRGRENDYDLIPSDKEDKNDDKDNFLDSPTENSSPFLSLLQCNINKNTDPVVDDSDNSKISQVNNESGLTEPQDREVENDFDLLPSVKEVKNDDFFDSLTENSSPFLSLLQGDINKNTGHVDGDSDNSKSSQVNNESELTEPESRENTFDLLPSVKDDKNDDFLDSPSETSLPFLSLAQGESEDSS